MRAIISGFASVTAAALFVGPALADTPPLAGYPQITSADAESGQLFIAGSNFGVAPF